jgi:hypothetical protein
LREAEIQLSASNVRDPVNKRRIVLSRGVAHLGGGCK